jgi:lipopolysaccharide export system protein LptA
MTMARYISTLLLGAALLASPAVAFAQPQAAAPSGPANALQGFSKNRDQPVKISAGALEVQDKNKIATFSGNVQVLQGDTMLRCQSLKVFYDQDDSKANTMKAAQPGPAGQGKIRRLEAIGGVVVTQKEQTATGDKGIFEMAENTVTLNGNVLVSQGQNILRGDRLVVNLTSGVSHMEAGKGGKGRVEAVLQPSSVNKKEGEKGSDKSAGEPPKNNNANNNAVENNTPDAPLRRSMHPSGLY